MVACAVRADGGVQEDDCFEFEARLEGLQMEPILESLV